MGGIRAGALRGSRRFSRPRLSVFAASMALACVGLQACGDDGGDVGVRLHEWEVVSAETSTSAGSVTFSLENDGDETHEFVVIRTDLEAGDLPTAEDGSVDEEGGEMEVVDEVEDIPSGESEELAVDLEAGHYALICNIVEEEDGETESHYANGMRADFEVE